MFLRGHVRVGAPERAGRGGGEAKQFNQKEGIWLLRTSRYGFRTGEKGLKSN